jgi:hypothetical protein
MTVILALVRLDVARPINCEVRIVSCMTSSNTILMGCNSKVEVIFTFVSNPPDALRSLITQ